LRTRKLIIIEKREIEKRKEKEQKINKEFLKRKEGINSESVSESKS